MSACRAFANFAKPSKSDPQNMIAVSFTALHESPLPAASYIYIKLHRQPPKVTLSDTSGLRKRHKK